MMENSSSDSQFVFSWHLERAPVSFQALAREIERGGSAPLPSVQTLVLSSCGLGRSRAAAESLWFWTLNTSPPVLLLISEVFENVWVAKSMGKPLGP